MRLSVFILFIFSLQGCSQSQKPEIEGTTFTEIDCTYFYSLGRGLYLIKLIATDTVYIKNIYTADSNVTYLGVLDEVQRLKLDTILNKININTIHLKYDSYDHDGDESYLYIEKDTIRRTTYLHGMGIPKELEDLLKFLDEIKRSIALKSISGKVHFKGYDSYLTEHKKYSR